MSLFSSTGGSSPPPPAAPPLLFCVPSFGFFGSSLMTSDTRLQRGFEKRIEIAVEHLVGGADFDAGAQILDARLIEHVRADLVTPAHVGLRVFQHACGGVALVHFQLVELRF